MATKAVKDLMVGDVVRLVEPEGAARITRKEKSRLFTASGGCFALWLRVTAGPDKGATVRDQHHAGDTEVELA
jgi:hypothetical protein